MSHIFLTGGTGVIGSALIPQLLENPDVELTLLLRATSEEHLDLRARELLRFCGVPSEASTGRVRFVAGDVCEDRFGLSARQYADLARSITGIIHSAGNVRLNQSLDSARRDAVDPVRHILSLAQCAPQLRKIDAVSTVGVAGRLSGIIPEERLTCEREFHNTYEQAKAEAEELLWNEIEKGLPVTIHRPSMVVGDSRNGAIPHYQVFYYLCDFLTGCKSMGLLPYFGDAALDIIPTDFAARTICHSAIHETNGGRVLHLCTGDRPELKLDVLAEKVRAIYSSFDRPCAPRRNVSLPLFQLLVHLASWGGAGGMRKSARALRYFLTYLNEEQRFSGQVTSDLPSRQNIMLDPIGELLPRILAPYILGTRRCIP